MLADEVPYKFAIGLVWWKAAVLSVKHAHQLRLFKFTNNMFCSRLASLNQVRQIVRLWKYNILLHRPTFSILYHTFRFLEQTDTRVDFKQRVIDSFIDGFIALLDVSRSCLRT